MTMDCLPKKDCSTDLKKYFCTIFCVISMEICDRKGFGPNWESCKGRSMAP